MITLIGTHERMQTALVMPNPNFGDSENTQNTMSLKRAIDGTKYTYVKRPSSTKLVYPLRLTRDKAIELENFVRAYFKFNIRLYNHKDEIWVVRFLNEAFDFQRTARGEIVTTTLELEGYKL